MLMVNNSLQSITVYEMLKERLHQTLLGTIELKLFVGAEFLSIFICTVFQSLNDCLLVFLDCYFIQCA